MLTNLLYVFFIILLTQVLFFIYAAIKRTDKVTDLSYGLTFIIGSLSSLLLNWENISVYSILLFTLITLWGLRLAGYLFIRVLREGKDARFDGIREDVKKFASFWSLQAVTVFVVLLPSSIVLLSPYFKEITSLSVFGLLLGVAGLLIEGIADYQKFVFKNDSKNKGKFIQSGLWKYSRHPNYLGEIMVWVGIFLYSLFYLNGLELLGIVSPIFITYLLTKVSGIPTLEKKYDEIYGEDIEYIEYKKNTGVLLPKLMLKK